VSMRCLDDKRRLEAKQSADLRRKISTNSCYLRIGGGKNSTMSLTTQNTSLQSGTDLSGTPSPVVDNGIVGGGVGGVSMIPNPGDYDSHYLRVEEEAQQSKL